MHIHELDLIGVEIGRIDGGQPVRSLLVRVAADSGEAGWGEAPLHWSADELPGRRDGLLAALRGRGVFDVEELHLLPAVRRSPLRAGLEVALWDLMGRACRQPVCHLLGGCFRRRVPVAAPLCVAPPERLGRMADESAQQGFLAIVLQLSGHLENDLAAARTVAEAVGGRVELRLDAARHYTAEMARDLCAELEYEKIGPLIDPLDTNQLHAMAALGRQTTVPLAVGRAIGEPKDALAAVRCGAASLLVLDLDRLGGLLPVQKAITITEAGELGTALAVGPSVGVATAALLQVAAARPALGSANHCPCQQLKDDVLVDAPELIDGMLTVPEGPGLGVEIDRAKLDRYQIA